MAYRLHVFLDEDDPGDQVVIAALGRLGERGKSRWVRRVLFEAVNTAGAPAYSEILDELRAIREELRRLESGVVATQPTGDAPEPENAARNLDGLLGRLETW